MYTHLKQKETVKRLLTNLQMLYSVCFVANCHFIALNCIVEGHSAQQLVKTGDADNICTQCALSSTKKFPLRSFKASKSFRFQHLILRTHFEGFVQSLFDLNCFAARS